MLGLEARRRSSRAASSSARPARSGFASKTVAATARRGFRSRADGRSGAPRGRRRRLRCVAPPGARRAARAPRRRASRPRTARGRPRRAALAAAQRVLDGASCAAAPPAGTPVRSDRRARVCAPRRAHPLRRGAAPPTRHRPLTMTHERTAHPFRLVARQGIANWHELTDRSVPTSRCAAARRYRSSASVSSRCRRSETERGRRAALEAGYRHIDTAAAYRNEAAVGPASTRRPDRGEVYITTKCWNDDQGYEEARRACEASLERLELTTSTSI